MAINRLNGLIVGYFVGMMALVLSVFMLIPIVTAFVCHEPQIRIYGVTMLFWAIAGGLLIYLCRHYNTFISKRDGQISVALLWIIIPLLGSLPYMFFPDIFSINDAIFESYSGFTTTGSTVVDDFEHMPKSLLCYRSMTQWIGGMGFTVIIIMIIRRYSGSFNNFFTSEFFFLGLGRMYPLLKDTVKRIFVIYSLMTLACFVCLILSGLNWVNALCYSFSTVSTGGFTTSASGLIPYGSLTQYIIMFFMFISGVSFFLIVQFFQGKLRLVVVNEQLRYYVLLILVVSLCFAGYLTYGSDMSWADRIRTSLFSSVSMVSSTGYNINVRPLGVFVNTCLILLMFIGGCSASSASGLKVIRVIILFRYARTALVKIFHPHAVVPVRYNGKSVLNEDVRSVFGFFFLYLVIFIAGIFVLSCMGNDLSSSMTMTIANLGNIGPVTGHYMSGFSYSGLSSVARAVLILLMLLGRLEIYTFISLFSKSLYKRR